MELPKKRKASSNLFWVEIPFKKQHFHLSSRASSGQNGAPESSESEHDSDRDSTPSTNKSISPEPFIPTTTAPKLKYYPPPSRRGPRPPGPSRAVCHITLIILCSILSNALF